MPNSQTLLFHEAAREKILRGIDVLALAVRVTLGPRGRTVVVADASGRPRVVNSGVVVARAIALEDRFENMGVQLLREVASRTSEMAGDGTTTATVLAHCMIHEGLRYVSGGMDPMALSRGLDKAVLRVVEALRGMAQPCTSALEMAHVASLSANNDRAIGELLAAAMERVGRTGAVSIEDGTGLQSVLEVAQGLQLQSGYLSPYFINNRERQCVVLEDVAVLLCDGKMGTLKQWLPLLDEAAGAARPLLLITAEPDAELLAALVLNSVGGALKACAVKAPGLAASRQALLADLAIATGGRVVGAELGLPLEKLRLADLGRAQRVEVSRDSTTLIGGAGAPGALQQRIAEIRAAQDRADKGPEHNSLGERAARLSGGVAVIKVGAATETELRERKLRVEDALHATRAAVEEGILPGGGVALLRARQALAGVPAGSLEEAASMQLVMRALEEPLRRIASNAGEEPSVVVSQVEAAKALAYGFNAANRSYGDMLEMGVIDPFKVTRLALQNAASIAGLVLGTDCLVAQPAARANPALLPGGGEGDW